MPYGSVVFGKGTYGGIGATKTCTWVMTPFETMGPDYPVQGGVPYSAMADFIAMDAPESVNFLASWYESDGTFIRNDTVTVSAVVGSPTQALIQVTSPSNAVWVGLSANTVMASTIQIAYQNVAVVLGTTSIWSPGGFLGNVTAQIQRSYDGGQTWADVGAGTPFSLSALDLMAEEASGFDEWAPFATELQYRSRLVTDVSGQLVTSDWSDIQTVTLDDDMWALDPLDPTTAVQLRLVGDSWTIPESRNQGIFWPIGRKNQDGNLTAVVVQGGRRAQEFDLPLQFHGDADVSWQAFLALWARGSTVLVKGDMPGLYFYVSMGDLPNNLVRTLDRLLDPHREVTVHCTPVAAP